MINLFFRHELLAAAEEAIERMPSLSFNREHHSLVLFRRERQSDSHISVLLFDNWNQVQDLMVEIFDHSKGDYHTVAADLFGDKWTLGDIKEIIKASEYAMRESIDGNPIYRLKGSFKDMDLHKMATDRAAELEKAEEQKKFMELTNALARDLGCELNLAGKLVKFGIVNTHLFSGVTVGDLTTGENALEQYDAETAIDLATKAKFV
jgi:hypothetical protein